jgi:hypothetical protein
LSKDAKVVLVEGALDGDVPALLNGRTVLWEVAVGALGSVEGVDQIIVLKDGQLAESGSYKELLEADGVFASMWADHLGASAPIPGSSSATASGAVEGYEIADAEAVSGPVDSETQSQVVGVIDASAVHDSPRAFTASIRAGGSVRAPSFRAPTASVRAPSIRPSVSQKAESVAPSVPTKDHIVPVSFPTSGPEEEAPEPVSFPSSSDAAPLAFPTSSDNAPLAFPTTSDDSRSINSASQTHIRLPTAITFDTTATPPRVSTPDPTNPGSSSSTPGAPNPETEGKRKRIGSQNFQRLARRISLSTPRKGAGIQGIPGIAGIAGVLRRDSSFRTDKDGKDKNVEGRDSLDAVGTSSAPETARSSGEIGAERTDKDKEREEKKRKRKSFMEVVGAMRGDSAGAGGEGAGDAN